MHMDAATIAQALSTSEAMAGRQDVLHTASGITVVDDSYNANPDSMRASLSMFGSLSVPGHRFAILGDMAELGDYTVAGHRLVGEYAARAGGGGGGGGGARSVDLRGFVGCLDRFRCRRRGDAARCCRFGLRGIRCPCGSG